MNASSSTSSSHRRRRRLAGLGLLGLTGFVGVSFGFDAAATPATFPADTEWLVVTRNGVPLSDPPGDTPGGSGPRDIVGDSTFPMLYVASDDTHLYFRMRVNGDPTKNATEFQPFGWGCFIDTDGVLNTYEFSTLIDGVANPDTLSFYKNTVTTTLNSPNDPPDQPPLSVLLNPLSPGVGHARVVLADSTFSNNADYFIDWAVELNVALAEGFDPTEQVRIYCGSSNNGTTISADCSGGSASCLLDTQFSDPLTCGTAGCGTCGDGTVAGSEGCDDGNLASGDGCNAECLIELGFGCNASGQCDSGFCDTSAPVGNFAGVCACDGDADCPNSQVCDTSAAPNACVECFDSTLHCLTPGAPVCEPMSNTCVECVLDSDCTGDLVCSMNNTCVQCSDDSDCTSGDCDENTNTCVGCDSDADCPTGTVCETTSKLCVTCLSDPDCTGNPGGPICKVATDITQNTCVQCTDGSHCTTAGAEACDPGTNTCVECIDQSTCAAGEVCDTSVKLCVACLTNDHCSAPTPLCKTGTPSTNNACVECLVTSDCGTGFVCNQATNQCVICNNDSDCVGNAAGPACDLGTNTCVGCVNDTPCLPGACDLSTQTCVECLSDDNCVDDPLLPVCNTASQTCVGCLNDSQCASGVCDQAITTCVECLVNDDCADPTPLCKTGTPSTTNSCVECLTTDDCTGVESCNPTTNTCEPPCTVDADCEGNLVCDPQSTTCVECVDDGDCPTGVCDTDPNICVECLLDTDCDGNQVCKLGTTSADNTCVECVEDGDCATGVCDDPTNTCVECNGDADCPNGVCDTATQTCVECLSNADCTDPNEPVCKQGATTAGNTCVECTQDSDCDSDNCNTSTNTCGPPPETGCTSDAQCSVGQVCEDRDCIPGCRVDGSGNGCPTGQECVEVSAGNPVGRCETPTVEPEPGFDLQGGGCSCRAAGSTEGSSSGGLPVALFGLALGGALLRSRRRQG